MIDVIVIGAGASGMLFAISALRRNKKVLIIEKNEKVGKKMFITGKGRCNLTNMAQDEEFFENIVSNKKFFFSAYSLFNNKDVVDLVEANGVETKVERGKRVFPCSDKSSDIIKALKKEIEKHGGTIRLNTKVTDILIEGGKAAGVVTSKGEFKAPKIVVATGGMSYKSTGSDGDGYTFAKDTGHNVTKLLPGLIPINCTDTFLNALQGLTLKNVKLSCKVKGKKVYDELGEMLFAHFGITGPLVLTLSSVLGDVDFSTVELAIDLKPALSVETLDKRLLRDFAENKNKQIKNVLEGLLPRTMIPVFLKLLLEKGIDIKKQVNSVTKGDREQMISLLKNFEIHPKGYRNLDYAIVTKGGVSVKDVNPKTMESKKVSGLYFVGEVLDLDALTGGFNLQIAFSTGYCGGQNC